MYHKLDCTINMELVCPVQSFGSFLPVCVLATSLIELSVFVNHVFLDAWISLTAACREWVRSCVLHSDSTRASFVWASSNSSSRTCCCKSTIFGFIFSGSIFGSGKLTFPSASNILEQASQDLTKIWKKEKMKPQFNLNSTSW